KNRSPERFLRCQHYQRTPQGRVHQSAVGKQVVLAFFLKAPLGRCFPAGQTSSRTFEIQEIEIRTRRAAFGVGCDKREVNLFLASDGPHCCSLSEIGKIVKRGPQFRSARFDPREKLARLLRMEPKMSAPENHGHHANLTMKSLIRY